MCLPPHYASARKAIDVPLPVTASGPSLSIPGRAESGALEPVPEQGDRFSELLRTVKAREANPAIPRRSAAYRGSFRQPSVFALTAFELCRAPRLTPILKAGLPSRRPQAFPVTAAYYICRHFAPPKNPPVI